jgi:transcriptional regulator with XRE-family HTH domain
MTSALEPLYARVGEALRRARERRGLTQEELAARLSPPLTRAAICNMENGVQRIMLHVLVDAADACGVTAGQLLRSARTRRVPRTEGGRSSHVRGLDQHPSP